MNLLKLKYGKKLEKQNEDNVIDCKSKNEIGIDYFQSIVNLLLIKIVNVFYDKKINSLEQILTSRYKSFNENMIDIESAFIFLEEALKEIKDYANSFDILNKSHLTQSDHNKSIMNESLNNSIYPNKEKRSDKSNKDLETNSKNENLIADKNIVFSEQAQKIVNYFTPIFSKLIANKMETISNRRLENLNNEMTSLIVVNEDIKKELRNERINNSLLQKKLDELYSKLANLEEQDIETVKNHNSNQEKKLKDIIMRKNKELSDLRDEINLLKNKNFEQNNNIEFQLSEYRRLEFQINEFKNEIQHLKQIKIKFENFFNNPDGIESIKDLKFYKEKLEKELINKDQVICEIEIKAKEFENEMNFYKNRFLEIISEYDLNFIEELKNDNLVLKEQIKELNSKLEFIYKDNSRKENIMSNFSNYNLSELDFKIKDLSNENKYLKGLLEKSEQVNQDLNKQIDEINQKFFFEKNNLLSIMNHYNNELNNFKAYFMKISNEKNFSDERNQHLVNTINQYFNKLKTYEKNISTKTDFLLKNEVEINKVKQENMQINNRIDLISKENDELKENFNNLQEKYFKLKTECDNYNKMYNEKIMENITNNHNQKDYEKEIIKIKNEKAIIEGELKALRIENFSLNKKIEELNKIMIQNKREILNNNRNAINQEKLHLEFQVNHNKLRDMFDQISSSKENMEKIKNYYAQILRERENKIFDILNENNLLSLELKELKSINENIINDNRNSLQRLKEMDLKYKKLHMILVSKNKNN